ncbi:MAG: class I SAM-dependent methyltransferase [Alphaproteobacteria bacterium]|nr:class I SAM-dependent methyltransferase [Alphaproteobacteria bacterium]MBN9568939.1 class I SAM-dependent methyltransferase [Alphaproteobacteria bacterium]
MRGICGLCHRDTLEDVYQPEGSTRGITVHLCRHCGLVQSLPRVAHAPRRPPSVSGGADWGNVRYGKGFRTRAALAALARHADLATPLHLLDVGSNRGSFAKAFLDAAPSAQIVAVEPDERVAESCAGLARTQLITGRIENVALEDARFDIVHSCHTIEHLADPAQVLADHWRVLKDGGLLVLDAPNLAFLGGSDVVEEWFIDKHLYHFSVRTLLRMLGEVGFTIIDGPDAGDRDNILIVARKAAKPQSAPLSADTQEVESARTLIAHYIASRARNLMALTAVAAEIAAQKSRGVAIWGAGRIFDNLVRHGHFDATTLNLLIDTHLKAHVRERHGCTLAGPEALADAAPGVVVVMSRAFAGEISEQVRSLAPGAEILLYSDLLARAQTRAAA